MEDNTLWWILGIGVVAYFGYEYLQNQSAAEAVTPATSTVTTSGVAPVTAPASTTQTGQIATAASAPVNLPSMQHSFGARGPMIIPRGRGR